MPAITRWSFAALLPLSLLAASHAEGSTTDKPSADFPAFTVSARVPLVKVGDFKMRESRVAAAAVTDGRYIYIIGGQDSGGHILKSVERFDPQSGKSEPFAELRHARLWHEAALHAGKIYVLGGSSEGLLLETLEFRDTLRVSREQHALDNINEASLPVPGSMDLEGTMEVLDLATRRVSDGKPMPDARNQFACVTLGDDLYVIGGRREYFGRPSYTNTVVIYSFRTGRWRNGIPMPTPRASAGALVDGPFVVVPGGYDGMKTLDAVEAFDPRGQRWIILPRMCRTSSAHSVAFLGHSLFLFGNYVAPDELIALDLRTKQSESFTLQYKPARHTAVVVVGERIYVLGGKVSKDAKAVDYIQVFALPAKMAAADGHESEGSDFGH